MKGFSRTNLMYMRAFAEGYPDEQIVQQLIGQIPWGHNIRILDTIKDQTERLWYIQQTIQHGWSRNVLVHQIESQLYHRQGKATIINANLISLRSLVYNYLNILIYSQLPSMLQKPLIKFWIIICLRPRVVFGFRVNCKFYISAAGL